MGQKRKFAFTDLREAKLGPFGMVVMVAACTVTYLIFFRPALKEYRRRDFQNQADRLIQLQKVTREEKENPSVSTDKNA